MKYIENYKIFENNENVLNDVKEMLFDIEDLGFHVTSFDDQGTITILITKPDDTFNFTEEMKNCVLRIYNYMTKELKYKPRLTLNDGDYRNFFVKEPRQEVKIKSFNWSDDDLDEDVDLHFIDLRFKI